MADAANERIRYAARLASGSTPAAAGGGVGGDGGRDGSSAAAGGDGGDCRFSAAADGGGGDALQVLNRGRESSGEISVVFGVASGQRSTPWSIIRHGAAGLPVIIDLTYRGQCRVRRPIGAPIGPPSPVPPGAPVGPRAPVARVNQNQSISLPVVTQGPGPLVGPASFFYCNSCNCSVCGRGGWQLPRGDVCGRGAQRKDTDNNYYAAGAVAQRAATAAEAARRAEGR